MVLEQQVSRPRAKLGEAGESRTVAWGMTSVLVAMYVINFADKAVLGIIAQPLAKELGLSASDIGLAGSAFFLMLSLGGLFSGALDKWLGLRWALVLLVVLWSVAMLPLMLSASFVTLLVSRMILGFAEGPNSPLLFSAAYSWHAPARRGQQRLRGRPGMLGCVNGAHAIPRLSSCSASYSRRSGSIRASRSPAITCSILYKVRLIRWSVTRPCGKL